MQPDNLHKLEFVDALRGVAILAVVCVHVSQIVFHPGLLASLFTRGALGVQLFFVLSTFTLFHSLENRSNIDLKNTTLFFYLRRFFRIVPAFTLFTLVYIFVFFLKNKIILNGDAHLSIKDIIVNISYLGIFFTDSMYKLPFGSWTVHIEMIFYLFVPLLYKMLPTLRSSLLFFFFSLVTSEVMTYLFPEKIYTSLLFINQIPVFILGIIVFHLYKQKSNLSSAKSFLCALIIILFSFMLWRLHIIHEHIFFSIFFCFLILFCSLKRRPLFENKLTQFYGTISYSLYLSHFLIVLIFWYTYRMTSHFWGMPQLFTFILLYTLTLLSGGIFSFFLHKYLEKAGIRAGKKIIQRYASN